MLDPIHMGFRIIRLVVRVFYYRASKLTNCSPSGNPCDSDFLFALLRAGVNPLARREPSLPELFFSTRGYTTRRLFWAGSRAELNQCGPDFSVRGLGLNMAGIPLAFYLPSSIGLLQLNFRNAITLELHERACWPEIHPDHGKRIRAP